MNLDLVVCPGCRTASEGRLDVRTMTRAGDLLVCECGRRYPIVDGVPIVMAHAHAYLRTEIATVVERDLAPEVAALRAAIAAGQHERVVAGERAEECRGAEERFAAVWSAEARAGLVPLFALVVPAGCPQAPAPAAGEAVT